MLAERQIVFSRRRWHGNGKWLWKGHSDRSGVQPVLPRPQIDEDKSAEFIRARRPHQCPHHRSQLYPCLGNWDRGIPYSPEYMPSNLYPGVWLTHAICS